MVNVSYHASIKDLQGLRSIEALMRCGPFTRPAWFYLLEEYEPLAIYVMARDDSGAVILPLLRDGNGLESLINWYSFNWEPLMTLGADVPKLLQAALKDLGQHTGELRFSKLDDADGWIRYLEDALKATKWVVVREKCDTNHFLDTQGLDYATYFNSRPGRLRSTIKRKTSALEIRLGTQFTDRLWADYEDIYADSWKTVEGEPSLLRRFAEREARDGRLRLGFALHSGEPVAAQFWTVEDGIAYIHKLSYRENRRNLSPGTVLTAAMMEQAIDHDHVIRVDFGTGDDPFKRDWMSGKQERTRLTAWRREVPRNWPAICKSSLRKLVSR